MAGSVGPADSADPMVEVNTTPLIDVMLVLLVMLIVTLPIQMHGIQLDNPPPIPDEPLEPPIVIDITIDFDGAVSWNGVPIASSDVLDNYFKQVAAQNPQPEIHIRPDELVKWDYVAKVLAVAQRDQVEKIGFTGNERFF